MFITLIAVLCHSLAGGPVCVEETVVDSDAYKDLTGDDWKAYEAPAEAQVEKKAATAQIGAFAG